MSKYEKFKLFAATTGKALAGDLRKMAVPATILLALPVLTVAVIALIIFLFNLIAGKHLDDHYGVYQESWKSIEGGITSKIGGGLNVGETLAIAIAGMAFIWVMVRAYQSNLSPLATDKQDDTNYIWQPGAPIVMAGEKVMQTAPLPRQSLHQA